MTKPRKRIISAILVVVIAISAFSVTSFADKTKGKIDGFSGTRGLADTFVLGQSGSPFYTGEEVNNVYNIEVVPGEEVRIPLTADMFTWSNGKKPLPMEAVNVKDLTASKVTVRTLTQKGALALDYVQLETDVFKGKPFHPQGAMYPMTGRTAYISVMFAEEYQSVKELEFRYDIYLIVDGKERSDDMKITLYGTMKNPELDVDSSTDYVNVSDGTVAVSDSWNQSVKVDAGNGVTIERIMIPNKKYYATTAVKHSSDPGFEEDYPSTYPTVQMAVKLNTVNMRYGKSNVKIDTKDETVYYVYGEKMQYMGMSNETLHYSDMYFLSTEEIPTFEKDQYLSDIKNLPTSKPLGYDTGEDSEEVYLAAEQGKTPVKAETTGVAAPSKTAASEPVVLRDKNGVDMGMNYLLENMSSK